MKKNYVNLFIAVTSAIIMYQGSAQAQCVTPPTPTLSGTGVCGSFPITSTLTTTGASSLQTGWYANSFGGNAVGTGTMYVTPSLTAATVYYAAQLAPTTTESLSLPAQASTLSGNVRGYWFSAPASFVITGVRVPTDNTGNASVAIVKLPTTPPTYPATTNTFDILYLAQNVVGTGTMNVNIPVYNGDIIGVLGVRNDVNSYANSPYSAMMGTTAITLTRLGMQFPLSTTAPQDLWTEASGSISRVELYTTMGCLNALTAYTVTSNPNPTVTAVSNMSLICSGQSATVSLNGAVTYTSNPAIPPSNVITPTTNTTYTVTGSDAFGCQDTTVFTQAVSLCTGLSSSHNQSAAFAIYPNPTTGSFTIELANSLEKNIQLFDVTGRVVLEHTSYNDTINLNIGNLASGIYYVKVKSNNKTETLKLLKQ